MDARIKSGHDKCARSTIAPGFSQQHRPSISEGAGNAGCSDAPIVSCVEKHTVVTTGEPRQSGIPCANGFNGFLRGLPGDRAFLPPSPREASASRGLIPASRYQDATTSPSASPAFVVRKPKRPPLPAPNVRDDRETPLL